MVFSFCNQTTPELSSSSGCLFGRSHESNQQENPTSVMIALADEIEGLSLADKESAYDNLHCTAPQQKEDPEQVERGLHELDQHLEKIQRASNAYRTAKEQNLKYGEDRKFRLMFLRAEEYDAIQAAQRILRFFDEKLRLFGRDKLTEDILYNDLSEDDRESLECGAMQYCPLRDRGGRKIFFGFASKKKYKLVENYLRAQFYLLMSAVEDEQYQLLGLTSILYNVDSNTNDAAILWGTAALRAALPIRLSSGHVCMRDSNMSSMLRVSANFMPNRKKMAGRIHIGTHTECMYALMGYGIPVGALPFRSDDTPTVDYHWRWIEERKALDKQRFDSRLQNVASMTDLECLEDDWSLGFDDTSVGLDDTEVDDELFLGDPDGFFATSAKNEATATDDGDGMNDDSILSTIAPLPQPSQKSLVNEPIRRPTVQDPSSSDVLLGRGRAIQKHTGNKRFRKLIATHIEAYEQAGKTEKTRIGNRVLELVKGESGCFLQLLESGLWEEIDDNAARLKIASAFRSVRKDRRRNGVPSEHATTPEAAMVTSAPVLPNLLGSGNTLSSSSSMVTSNSVEVTEGSVGGASPADVLFGRGKSIQNHPGNIQLRTLIASRLSDYEKASYNQKTIVAGEVIRCVKEATGRFLKESKEGDGWEEVDDHAARSKVASAFRAARKNIKDKNARMR